jgi:hypothetical protein
MYQEPFLIIWIRKEYKNCCFLDHLVLVQALYLSRFDPISHHLCLASY